MWKRLRYLLSRLGIGSRKDLAERRTTEQRARFWAEVREGEREAEEHSRP